MTDYISREWLLAEYDRRHKGPPGGARAMIEEAPAEDVVSWEFLERYADYFCAIVSMPEFIREAKAFYASTKNAMEGGHIGE